jgi:hypothetical protein
MRPPRQGSQTHQDVGGGGTGSSLARAVKHELMLINLSGLFAEGERGVKACAVDHLGSPPLELLHNALILLLHSQLFRHSEHTAVVLERLIEQLATLSCTPEHRLEQVLRSSPKTRVLAPTTRVSNPRVQCETWAPIWFRHALI